MSEEIDPMQFQTDLLSRSLYTAMMVRIEARDRGPTHNRHGRRLFDYNGYSDSWHSKTGEDIFTKIPHSDNNGANEFIRNKEFIDLPDSARRCLTPVVRIYKTFLDKDTGERTDLRLKTDYYNNGVNRIELEKVDFTRLGGNPAEVDTNINFNILLSARELGFYLKRQYPKSEQGRSDSRTLELESRGVAWIDLIKIDPGRSLDVDEIEEDEQVTNQSDARIRVELGYQPPVDSQQPKGMTTVEWLYWKDIISKQKEEFYLSLFKHNFDFKSSGEVGLSIDFKASASARMLDPKADILTNPKINDIIKRLSEQRKILKQQLRKANKDDEDCMERLTDELAVIEAKIKARKGAMKNRLLAQLYGGALLKPGNKSVEVQRAEMGTRLFSRRLPANRAQAMYGPSIIGIYFPRDEDLYDDISTDFGGTESFSDNENIEQFIFIGDIVQAAVNIVAENYEYGGTHQITHIGSDITWYYTSLGPGPERTREMYRDMGIISLGKVSWTNPLNPDTTITMAQAELPISLKLFRAWFSGISSKKSMPLRDFIKSLFTDFLTKEIFGKLIYDVDDVEEETIKPEFSLIATAVPDEVRNPLNGRITSKYSNDQFGWPASVFLVQQNSPPTPQELEKLPELLWGQSTRGIMEGVSFEREDIPGYAEARLFSDRQSTSNNLAIREKYNATIKMLGNTIFLPGSQLNLLPEPLDLGFTDEKDSIARSLGLGGIFVVHRIENQIDMVKRSWDTQLVTKWESFGTQEAQESPDVADPC